MPSVGSALVAALAAMAPLAAAKDGRTFAVLRFHGNGPLTTGRSDPIVSPGQVASHLHTVHGGSGFSNSATGADLVASNCSTANIKGDKSAYWMPSLFFHDKANKTFEPVELFYMNVYYFFEGTNDVIKPFPVGLQMMSGDAGKRTPPATGKGGAIQLDPSKGPVQPVQFTCPRTSFHPASYPAGSDGTMAGIQDPNNKGAGAGFPFAECDGSGSPLRADVHFPSCYDPSKALTDYRHNMQFPVGTDNNKQDCPAGWVHTPHLFYEMYWNTPKFNGRWTPNSGEQPFVLSNGDATGYSLHGDFMSGWDQDVLQHIIDTCDAGDRGMDQCAGVATELEGECHVANPSPEAVEGVLTALPGANPIFGWGYGAISSSSSSASSTAATAATYGNPYGVNNAVSSSAVSGAASSSAASASPLYSNITTTTGATGAQPTEHKTTTKTKTKGHGGACRAPTSKKNTDTTTTATVHSTTYTTAVGEETTTAASTTEKDTTTTTTAAASTTAKDSDTTTTMTIHSTTYTTATTTVTLTDAAPSVGTIRAYRRAHVRRHGGHH